jgi:hypothetical protein
VFLLTKNDNRIFADLPQQTTTSHYRSLVVVAHTSRQRRERDITTRGTRASQPHGVKIVVAAAREKDFLWNLATSVIWGIVIAKAKKWHTGKSHKSFCKLKLV